MVQIKTKINEAKTAREGFLSCKMALDSLAHQLQKEASEISKEYIEHGGTPFSKKAEGLSRALEGINDFFGTNYETDINILLRHFNDPVEKK